MERSVFYAAAHITHASFGVTGKAETGFDADQIGIGDVTHGMLPYARDALFGENGNCRGTSVPPLIIYP